VRARGGPRADDEDPPVHADVRADGRPVRGDRGASRRRARRARDGRRVRRRCPRSRTRATGSSDSCGASAPDPRP
jgi:hypothetical protein